jgi:hypothetical protein
VTAPTVVARAREHRDRPGRVPVQRQVSARVRRAALEVAGSPDDALTVRQVDGSPVDAAVVPPGTLRTLRRAAHPVEALRAAGVHGRVDVDRVHGERAGALRLRPTTGTGAVTFAVHTARYGRLCAPTWGNATVTVAGARTRGTAWLRADPTVVREHLLLAVMRCLAPTAWDDLTARSGHGRGVHLVDLDDPWGHGPVSVTLMGAQTSARLVAGPGSGAGVLHAEPDAGALARELGTADVAGMVGSFLVALRCRAAATLDLPHMGDA